MRLGFRGIRGTLGGHGHNCMAIKNIASTRLERDFILPSYEMFKSWSHLRYDYDADTTTKRLGVNKIVCKFLS